MANPTTNILQVSLPGPGQTQAYTLTADTPVKFNFDLSEAVFTGVNGNLEIVVEGGGTVILENYQALAESGTLPTFETLNGEQVAGEVYLFAFADAEDATTEEELETAADAGGGGSGAGDYSDDAGALFDGVDALGGQGDAFDGATTPVIPEVTGLDVEEEDPFASLEPPESEDFTVMATTGPTPISFEGLATDLPDSDHVWDEDDDLSDTDARETDITITSLPTGGTLYYEGVEVLESDLTSLNPDGSINNLGTLFSDHNAFTYVSNDGAAGVELGARNAGDANINNWGSGDKYTRTMELDGDGDGVNDITITTYMVRDTGEEPVSLKLKQFKDGDDGDHIGHGLGDKSRNGIDMGENLVIEFDGTTVESAEIGFSGLGGYLDPGSNQQAHATWVAYNGDDVVAWGTVNNDEMSYSLDPNLPETLSEWMNTTLISAINDGESGNQGDIYQTLHLDQSILNGAVFDKLVFGTIEDTTDTRNNGRQIDWNSNWELGHVFADFPADDSFDYAPVDSHGLVGNESTVTIEAMPIGVHDGAGLLVDTASTEVSVRTDEYGREDFGGEGSLLALHDGGNTVTLQAFTGDITDESSPWTNWNEARLGLEGRSDNASGGPGRDFNAIGVHEGNNEIDAYVRGSNDVEIMLVTLDEPAQSASVILEALFGREPEGAFLRVYGEDGTLLETRHVDGGSFDGRTGALKVSFDADDYGQAISNIVLYADNQPKSDFLIRGVDYSTMDTGYLTPVEGNILDNDFHGLNGELDVVALVSASGVDGEGNAVVTGEADIEQGIFTIEGQYGTLALDSETGAYSYEPNFGLHQLEGNVVDIFQYTVEDQGDNTDTAFLEIGIGIDANVVYTEHGEELVDGFETQALLIDVPDGDDVFLAADGAQINAGEGNDIIVIDPDYVGSEGGTITVGEFGSGDALALGDMIGSTVAITAENGDLDLQLVFSDIDGNDDITVVLEGVNPNITEIPDTPVDIDTSDALNTLIQEIIDSGTTT